MPKQSSGLIKRWSRDGTRYTWHIKKDLQGHKLRGSTGTDSRLEAEQILARRIEEHRQQVKFGESPDILFEDAAARYLEEHAAHKSIRRELDALDIWMPTIGHLPLRQVHQGTLDAAIKARQATVKNSTVNRDLAPVKRTLELAARLWRHEANGEPWLAVPPLIRTLSTKGKRKPYPMSWAEQALLFLQLPPRLEQIATLAVQTGMRAGELRHLEWSWQIQLPAADNRAPYIGFLLPGKITKNGYDRIVLCNRIAQRVIDAQRGHSRRWVWPSITGPDAHTQPIGRLMNHGWRSARTKAAAQYPEIIGGDAPWGYANVRVHDLRHTFGRRLRAAGASLEDRKELLGHVNGDVTSGYSQAELSQLMGLLESISSNPERAQLRVVDQQTKTEA